MSKDRFRSAGKADPDRWGSKPDVDSITDEAMRSIRDDDAHLIDFFSLCKRTKPDYFRRMTLAQFKAWNLQRLAMLDNDPPVEDYGKALRAIEERAGNRRWCPTDRKVISIDAWIEKHGPHPDDYATGRCKRA